MKKVNKHWIPIRHVKLKNNMLYWVYSSFQEVVLATWMERTGVFSTIHGALVRDAVFVRKYKNKHPKSPTAKYIVKNT
jgi:hypothetical protein